MDILLLTYDYSPYKGGESKLGHQWAIELSRKGHNVTVITNENNKKDINEFCEKKEEPDISFIFVKNPNILFINLFKRIYHPVVVESQLYQIAVKKELEKITKKKRYDIIHQVSPTDIRVLGFGMNFKIPFIIGPLGGGQFVPQGLKYYIRNNKKVELLRKIMTYLITRSPSYRHRINKIGKLLIANPETAEYLTSVYKDISYSLMADIGTTEYPVTSTAYKGSTDIIKLLWVGRLSYRKGLELLIDTLPYIDNKKKINLTIIGRDVENLRSMYEKKIEKLNLDITVKFLGGIPYSKIQDEYKKNDIFIFTSLRETGGSVLYEAAESGLPIIMPNQNMSYLLKNYAITFDITSRDKAISELSSAINILTRDINLRRSYSKKSLEFAEKNTFTKKVDQALLFYEEILNNDVNEIRCKNEL